MMKGILRTIGIICLLAGGVLYMYEQQTEKEQLQKQIETMKHELAAVKQELSGTKPAAEDAAGGSIIIKQFTVSEEMTAFELSKALEQQKLIEDAGKFDQYMIENNYTDKIKPGTYEFRSDMRFPEFARKLLQL